LDSAGFLYISETGGPFSPANNAIRKISPSGEVLTLAGSTTAGSANGTGSAAQFDAPHGLAVDSSGNVFVADLSNHSIRKITPAGVVTTFAGQSGSVGSADGTGDAARFYNPMGVTIDQADNVYVADFNNHTIRKITPSAVVTTIAGLAGSPGSTDGSGVNARFNAPSGIVVDGTGNIYVSDGGNRTIRKITPSRDVTTLAGLAGNGGSADGIGSAARFVGPNGLTVDTAGNVYVVDFGTVRKITATGSVTTLAGSPGVAGYADGTGTTVQFNQAFGIARDANGYLYVGDGSNYIVRRGGPTSVSQLLNISTRARVQTSDNVLIGGFILSGSVAKRILVRAIGPSLQSFGLPGFLADTTLELYDSNGAFIVGNDNWRDAFNAGDIQATGLPPSNDLESAILVTLNAGDYTAVVRGKNNTSGGGLVEVYDLNPAAASLAANISTRGFAETGDNVMIGGFISGGGSAGSRILVRAIGPSLSQSAISNPLSDPTLELHDGDGTLIAYNDNWKDSDQIAIEATGIPPSDDLESAIVSTLPAGACTAIVAGRNGGIGVALVEAYYLQ
jgi:sugar lactone lactonase YvrE